MSFSPTQHSSTGNLKCWLLWGVGEKLISILAVVGHKVIFLYQAEGEDVSYSLGVTPYWIGIFGNITHPFPLACSRKITL